MVCRPFYSLFYDCDDSFGVYTAVIRCFLYSFVDMCIRVYDDNGGFAGSRMKAATIAALHFFLPMWVVVIFHSSWLSVLLIPVCIGPILYGIRLLLRMPVEDMQVPFMESCDVMVWPYCILLLAGVCTRMLLLLLV